MSLRINTNVASLQAQGQMRISSRELGKGLSQLASGSRFGHPGSDSAGLAIAENLKAQEKGLGAASRTADVATSFVQTAEGSLNEQNNILIRMRELAVQAASDTYSDKEREFLDLEAQQLKEEFERIAQSARFGSRSLLRGDSSELQFQVGTHSGEENQIRFDHDADTTASSIGVSSVSVTDKSEARDSLESIDEALLKVGTIRAKFGAIQGRLETAQDFLASQVTAIAEARSKVADTDVAETVSRVRREQVLQQYQTQVLNYANSAPEVALKLIV